MSDKIITLITGANQGIGYYAAQQLAATGKYHVLLGSRDAVKGQKAVDAIVADTANPVKADDMEVLEIDVDSDDSITRAEKRVRSKFGRLDILVNNAGISQAPHAATLRAQYASLYNTNLFGAAVTTATFTPLLRLSKSEKRILFVSSSLSSLAIATADPSPFPANQYPLYRSTKTALNMLMAATDAELRGEGFVVGGLCPGYCGTNLNGFQGFKEARLGGAVIVRAVQAEKGAVAGKVIQDAGESVEGFGEKGIVPW